jgi:hypothetical protein
LLGSDCQFHDLTGIVNSLTLRDCSNVVLPANTQVVTCAQFQTQLCTALAARPAAGSAIPAVTLLVGADCNLYTLPLVTVVTASGIQGDGTAGNPIRENFDNLPLAVGAPVNIVVTTAAQPDGARVSAATFVCDTLNTLPLVPFVSTIRLVALDQTNACVLVDLQTTCPVAPAINSVTALTGRGPNVAEVYVRERYFDALFVGPGAVLFDPSQYNVLLVDASAGNVTVTLPGAPGLLDPCANNHGYIKRIDTNAANTVTVVAPTTIDNVASVTVNTPGPLSTGAGESVEIYFSPILAGWFII